MNDVKTTKRPVAGGEKFTIRLDGISHARMLHAENLSSALFGVLTNHSGIVRAALTLLVEHMDAARKKLVALKEDDPRRQLLVWRERNRLLTGTKSNPAPWRYGYPEHELRRERGQGEALPTFAELLKKEHAKVRIDLSDLPVPGEDLRRFLEQSDSTVVEGQEECSQ